MGSDSFASLLSRRQVIGSAQALLLAPFLFAPKRSFAAPPIPQNLVIVTWPEGFEKGWEPMRSGTSWTFPAMTQAMNPYRDDVCVIRGLRSGFTVFSALTAHTSGPLSLWTGATSKGGEGLKELPTLPSIDQLVANRITQDRPFKSLHFGVQTNKDSFISTPFVHFSGPKKPVPAEDDPTAMYRQIFQFVGQSQAELEKLRRRKKSVLDHLKDQTQRLKTSLSASDRIKMDEHATGLLALEKSLDGLTSASCGANTTAPMLTRQAALEDANFRTVIQQQTSLLTLALQCRLTRVATLQLSNTDSSTKIPGIATQRAVHEAQHSGTYDDRVAVGTFFVERLAELLGRLKAVDVGNGRTLLDDTLVVMGSDMAIGTHAPDPSAFFVAGGRGTVRLGTYLDVASTPPQHTKLLTTVVHAMGLTDITTVGDFPDADAKGLLPGVLMS